MVLNKKNTNILAIDFIDLEIISSMVQDCIVLRENMTFFKKQRVFILLVSRFRWEEAERKERIYSVIRFQGILGVKTKNLDSQKENLPLELLAINYETIVNEQFGIYLNFAGGAIIYLEAECVECILKDLSEPWKTNNIPSHDINEL